MFLLCKIIQVCKSKSGPANTLRIHLPEEDVKMDIDLVASFKFTQSSWPPTPFKPYCDDFNGKVYLIDYFLIFKIILIYI